MYGAWNAEPHLAGAGDRGFYAFSCAGRCKGVGLEHLGGGFRGYDDLPRSGGALWV